MAGAWKVIKPSRLRDDALRLELLNAMRRMGTKIKGDFEKTTATWKHKPKFEVLVSLKGVGPTVVVDTNDEIYRYVSEGTKPHVIRPRTPGGRLAFQGTYTAKTSPGVIGSTSGGSSGDMVYAREVHHPGTQARDFHKVISKEWQGKFKREMEEAMRKAARDTGHGM